MNGEMEGETEVFRTSLNQMCFAACRGFVTADVLVKGLSRGAIATGLT